MSPEKQSSAQPFKLGELLVREGYLTMDALQKVLNVQQDQKLSPDVPQSTRESRRSHERIPELFGCDLFWTLFKKNLPN